MELLRVVTRTISLTLFMFGAAAAHASVNECRSAADPAAAIAAADRGLRTAGSDTAARTELLLCRGEALENAGRLNEAARDYTAARDVAERTGNQKLLAKALAHTGYLRYYRGDFGDAIVDLQRAYDVSAASGNDAERRRALESIAHIYSDVKVAQYGKAIEYYTQLLREYEAANAEQEVADTLFNLGSTYDRTGDLAAALERYERALAKEVKLGRADEVAHVKRSIGITLTKLGRPADGIRVFDEALAWYAAHDNPNGVAQVRQSRGIAWRKLNRLDAAIADLEASRAYFQKTGNTRFLEKSVDELAEAYASAGQWENAFRARTAHAAQQRELSEKMREEHTSRLRVQFDTEKKEQENRALVRIRRLQNIVLALTAAVILALIGLAARHFAAARRMRVLAMTDELTRLPNRRHLFTTAGERLQAAQKNGEPFSIIVFDIDHFKRINDTWGHAAGDLVLQRVAHACRAAIRPQDAIGRTGGEEFMVVLPATTAGDASAVAERLRKAVEALDHHDIDPALRVTISLGVAEGGAGETTLARIAGRADDVLYQAKESGRNRVEVAA